MYLNSGTKRDLEVDCLNLHMQRVVGSKDSVNITVKLK